MCESFVETEYYAYSVLKLSTPLCIFEYVHYMYCTFLSTRIDSTMKKITHYQCKCSATAVDSDYPVNEHNLLVLVLSSTDHTCTSTMYPHL